MGNSSTKKHHGHGSTAFADRDPIAKIRDVQRLQRRDALQREYESATSLQFPSTPSHATATTSPTKNVNYNSLGIGQDLSHNLRFSNTVHTINNKVATATNNEKFSNENQTIKSANHADQQISLPKIQNFMTEWFSWKKQFITYMKSVDPLEINKDKWCDMLLNRMGPVGQEIYKTFTFEDFRDKRDIAKVLKKFDFYCLFGNVTRENAEETDKYVNALTVMASKHMTDTSEIVKEKILMEVDKDKFVQKVRKLIPGFSYPSGIQWLTVREMAYIWMSYENFDFERNEKIVGFQVKNCSNCGYTHAKNKCRAQGKQCTKCGIEDHFFYRCKSQHFTDCKRCGESHFSRQCPAYGNECCKCQKPNHFSWKCGFQRLLQCKFCYQMHYASKPCPM